MENIAIFGAGGFGREVKLIIDAINKVEPNRYNFIGFYDDNLDKGHIVNGYPILGGVEEINEIKTKLNLVISIANPVVKQSVLSRVKNENVVFPTLIHPNVSVPSEFNTIGEGVIICEGTIITCNITIDDFVILNLLCTVGHDTTIGKYSAFMPSVNVSGEVVVGEGVYVGTGAKIINLTTIGDYTIVGAGAVVAKSLPGHCTAVGMPAKAIKFHKSASSLDS